VIIVPTLASNDAPCSASSIIYDPGGGFAAVEFYRESPALVVVDSGVIAAAPERFLVSGMGDAMATWYESRVTLENTAGRSVLGGRPTIAAAAIGEACAATLFRHGVAAAASVAAGAVTPDLEDVIEANTLLSGIGFESGGLAAAHGVGQSLTAIHEVHDNHLHGEMVAFGVMTQLAMEDRQDEARAVGEFFASVGLPVRLEHLAIDPSNDAALELVARGTVAFPTTVNMPFPVDESVVLAALAAADEIGAEVSGQIGEASYRRLHASDS
jgi:glycerol dehydrogenase